jgi:methionyl aminopeptidase
MTNQKHEIMREAGGILRDAFSFIIIQCSKGKALNELDFDVGLFLAERKAVSSLKLYGFEGNISTSLNYEVVQGIPNDRILSEGDLVSIDLSIYYKGYFVDKARSFVIPPAHYIKKYLVSSVNKCLSVSSYLRGGMSAGEIGNFVESIAKQQRVHIGKEFSGHTIGEQPHMKPLIPNWADGSTDIIESGTYIALEPIIFYEDYYNLTYKGYSVSADKLSAHAEDTFLVTDDGLEVIT